ncbi:MAG: glycosyl hydrolase 43 family protein [Clostridium butyricum]|nr:glycosyl hydrolase 43 family protein [Clostridium butyricum]
MKYFFVCLITKMVIIGETRGIIRIRKKFMGGCIMYNVIYSDIPDLDIIRVKDVYYMVSTTMHMNPGVPIMKSEDLINWKIVNYVYDILERNDEQELKNGKNEYGKGSWASSIKYDGEYYYVEFSSYSAGGNGKTYIFHTYDIENGPWIKSEFDGVYRDAAFFIDDDQRTYLIYGGGDIYIIEIEHITSQKDSGFRLKKNGLNKKIIANANKADESWNGEGLVAEGTHVQKIGGKYYIFNIMWPKNGIRTEIIHRSDKIDGIYESRVMLKESTTDGIAQGGLVDSKDGVWYGFFFEDYGAVGRIPFIVPIRWEEGWPVINGNSKNVKFITSDLYNGFISSDNFEEQVLSKVWQWNHNPDNNWSLSERKGYLRLGNGKLSKSIHDAKNILTQRTYGPQCSGIISLDVTNMKEGDYAGIAAFQNYYGFVGVNVCDDSKYVVMAKGINGSIEEVSKVKIKENVVYLRVDFNFKEQIDEAYFYYSVDSLNWKPIGQILKMKYDLAHFMGYRFALFNYATKHTGGYVDFDYFMISDKI